MEFYQQPLYPNNGLTTGVYYNFSPDDSLRHANRFCGERRHEGEMTGLMGLSIKALADNENFKFDIRILRRPNHIDFTDLPGYDVRKDI